MKVPSGVPTGPRGLCPSSCCLAAPPALRQPSLAPWQDPGLRFPSGITEGRVLGREGRRWPSGSRLKMDILFVTIKTSDFSFINF